MPVAYKRLIMAAMTIGRVELLLVLVAIFPYRRKAKATESTAEQTTDVDEDKA